MVACRFSPGTIADHCLDELELGLESFRVNIYLATLTYHLLPRLNSAGAYRPRVGEFVLRGGT